MKVYVAICMVENKDMLLEFGNVHKCISDGLEEVGDPDVSDADAEGETDLDRLDQELEQTPPSFPSPSASRYLCGIV